MSTSEYENRDAVGKSSDLPVSGRDNSSRNLAKSDAIALSLAPSPNRKRVPIFQPLARFASRQFQRISSAPGQLQHATTRIFSRATDCAAGQEIARLQIATIDGVMSKLLGNTPIQVLKICPRNPV